jgi:hypothetical protein
MPSVNEIHAQNEMTFSIWLKRPKHTELQNLIAHTSGITIACNDKQVTILFGKELAMPIYPMPDDDNWQHIVLTISGISATLYIDARKVFSNDKLPTLTANAGARQGTLIGQENNEPDFLHRITLFHRALPADEILQLYRRGREKSVQDLSTTIGDIFDYDKDILKASNMPIQVTATAPALRNTPPPVLPSVYPFQINMTNRKDNVAPVIYIVSDLDKTTDVRNIDFEIKNTSGDTYQVKYFTLAFRRGTLHEDLTKNNAQKFCSLLKTAVKTAFALPSEPSVTSEETGGNINFMVNAESNNFSFPAITSVVIKLSGIYAAPGTGTRTSGYEIKFEGVQKVVGTKPSGAVFSFGRNAVLQVINHQGVSYAPVHFGVLGNNFLLNGHGGQAIAIFMQSLDGKELEFNEDTKFIFGFYSYEVSKPEKQSLAFGNSSEVDAISVGNLPAGFKNHKSEVDEHGRRDIIILYDGGKSASFLAFNFNKIALSGNSGLVKVHVEVENLPGYWDSNFDVTFIKGPMVMVGDRVGINTLIKEKEKTKDETPKEKAEREKEEKIKLSVTGDTFLNGDVGIGTSTPYNGNKLSVNGDTSLVGKVGIYSGAGNALEIHCGEDKKAISINQGSFEIGASDQNKFVVTKIGNVGIGTSSPTQKLDIHGDASISGNLILGDSPAFVCKAWACFEIGGKLIELTGFGNIKKAEYYKEGIDMYELSFNTMFLHNNYIVIGAADIYKIINGKNELVSSIPLHAFNGIEQQRTNYSVRVHIPNPMNGVIYGSIAIFF